MEPKWLTWAKEIQGIAQTGLTYAKDVFDIERYQALRELSVDILANYTYESKERIRLSFAGEGGYSTPKVDIRGVIFKDDKILLVHEKLDGKWALPGGWADIGLSPSEVAVKEIAEESGYQAEAVRLLAVMDKKFHQHPPEPYHTYKMFILCRITGGRRRVVWRRAVLDFLPRMHCPNCLKNAIRQSSCTLCSNIYIIPKKK